MGEGDTMTIALISLTSLFVAVVVSGIARLNVGIVALCFAWIIGYYLGGMSVSAVLGGFPIGLATILFGITLLFGQAQQNGTLAALAVHALRLTHGHPGLVPLLFFLITLLLATLGPGNIAAVALIAPLAMNVAGKMGINAFLMTLMVTNGANAGAFSPFAPTGAIANGLIGRLGLEMNPWTQVYLPSLLAQSAIALAGYLLFGGLRLWCSERLEVATGEPQKTSEVPLTWHQWVTIGAIGLLVVGVVVFKADIGLLAITLATLVALLGAAHHEEALKAVPWDTIIMVCGVSVLIELLDATGGMDLFTTVLARVSTTSNVTGVLALVAGIFSVYSSSSGVVMPTFIVAVPGLIDKLGGGDAVAMISAINVGSHVVDVSPLSTLGAMCIANAANYEDRDRLFRHLLLYSISMAVVGAGVCFLFFGLLW
jgi:Na+/H+ antiporter NhaD/arsenite permease-like protein